MYFYGISNRVNITRDGAQPEPVSNAQDAVSPKAQETVLSRSKASYRSKVPSTGAMTNGASKTRRIIVWISKLNPRRWWHRRNAYTRSNAGPPVIPPINVGDSLFLESLIRHTEDNIPRASTQPLLYRDSQPPPSELQSDEALPSYHRSLYDYPVEHSSLCGVPIMEELPPMHLETPLEKAVSRRNNFLLLRAPHPPTSFPLSPPSISHSRQTSQSKASIVTSSYDHAANRISSISFSSVSDRSSPLFYRAPRSTTPDTRTTSLPPITPTRERSLPVYPMNRAGSLTLSIRTEKGREDLEFPSPPTRWSGCWFAERNNNQTPQPSQPEEDEQSTEDDGMETPPLTAQQSQLSLENSTSGSGSLSPLPSPNVRTFGFGTASFFSLKAQTTARPKAKSALAPKPSDDDLGYADDEDLESVYSRFADVSLNTDMVEDALSDTDSHADPSLARY